jgi:hypothetical protein
VIVLPPVTPLQFKLVLAPYAMFEEVGVKEPIAIHACVLHACDAEPEQAAPPFAGVGFVQVRV